MSPVLSNYCKPWMTTSQPTYTSCDVYQTSISSLHRTTTRTYSVVDCCWLLFVIVLSSFDCVGLCCVTIYKVVLAWLALDRNDAWVPGLACLPAVAVSISHCCVSVGHMPRDAWASHYRPPPELMLSCKWLYVGAPLSNLTDQSYLL